MANTITIDAGATLLNRHAVRYNPTIQQALRTGLEFESILTPRTCDHTYSAPNVSIAEILQPYQSAFTPKGDVTFDAVDNTLQKVKVDICFDADELEDFWGSWRVDWYEIGRDPMVWTFPRWIYENVIMPKMMEELNSNAWSGVFAAPTPGTAGNSVTSVDGYAKKIADAITATLVTPINTGAFVSNTMVNQLETFCDSIPQPYRDAPGRILISPTNARTYHRDYRDKFGVGNGVNNPNDELRIDRTNKVLTPIVGMEGSDRIVFVPNLQQNMIWGTRTGFATYPSIRWEKFERKVKGMAEFYRFYGFEYWDKVFVNELT